MATKRMAEQVEPKAAKVATMQRVDCSPTNVRHPRNGAMPLSSNDLDARICANRRTGRNHRELALNEESMSDCCFYPESAIRDRATNRTPVDPATKLVMDQDRRCQTCRGWFMSRAVAQRHWCETLGIHGWIDCLERWECRRGRHATEPLVAENEGLPPKARKSEEERDRLSAVGDRLLEIGYVRKRETLNKTRMPKRLRRML